MGKLLNRNPEGFFPQVISDLKGFAIFMMDEDGIIASWNKGCEQIKEFTSEEAIGKNYKILFPDFLRDSNFPQNELEIAYKTGRFESENWRKKKSGELFWAHVVLTKILDDRGDFIGYIKITQDYTQRKHYEDELMQQKSNLQKVNRELDKAKKDLITINSVELLKKNIELTNVNHDLDLFVYTASHDLRNPISNLEGLLELIFNKNSYEEQEITPLLNMMHKSVQRLKKTIQELSEIGKIQKSTYDEDQDNALQELIEEVIFSLKDSVENSNAKINIEIDSCSDIKFPTRNLRSILYNLIINSINYSSHERDPEILISTQSIENYCVLFVKDNGLGIKKENIDKIFSKFKRFHGHVEGTGLGLYMVKRIVDNAGGKIEVESEPEVGTTIKIFFKV
ncbi:MAG: PAS domain-containing sensor histidine kinase [Bacteroidota bacterium]|nr:PAS domain-containing sensor histidine kinase [Bacteroidota bacterium]